MNERVPDEAVNSSGEGVDDSEGRVAGPSGSKPGKKIVRVLLPVVSSCLFGIALYVLYHQLHSYDYHEVVRYFRSIPGYRLLIALTASLMSYFCLTGYDTLALRSLGSRLGYSKIALASFTGYAFSNNVGYGPVSGGFIRYRLYSSWGLSAVEVTKVVAFCTLTSFLGFMTVAGLSFTIESQIVPSQLHLPFNSIRPVGILLIAVEAGYLVLLSARRKTIRIRSFSFSFPALPYSAAQAALASIDWIFSCTAIYFLLPVRIGISLPGFIGLYMLAQVAGLVSQVPGGLGVFEMVMVLLLPGTVSHSEVVGALLSFRVFYYFLPLTIASLLLGSYELSQRRENVRRLARSVARRITVVTPEVLTFVVFGSGAFLLFSGSLPLVHGRLTFLMNVFPLHVIEISHFLGSLTGVGLILLARAIQRRINAAYYLVMGLIGAGIALSLLKGLKYEEAFFLALVFVVLLPARREFYRKASIVEQRFSPGWVAAVFLVVAGSVWLGLFSYRHVEYTGDLWWHFSLKGDAPRFLRASVGVFATAIIFSAARLFHPAKPKPFIFSGEVLDRCAAVIEGYPHAYASLAYLGDKSILFSKSGKAFLMYGVQGRSWIALGDPVGPEEEWEELLWQFRDLADGYNGWTVFYEVEEKNLQFYQRAGLSFIKFGEEGRVDLQRYSLEGASRKKFRHIRNLLSKEGWRMEIVPREAVAAIVPKLQRISDDWLSRKGRREMGFSLGWFKDEYLKRFPHAVVKKGARIAAFANILEGGGKEELSVDLMRFSSKAPEGVMEFLFSELMLWGKEQGYRWFNLGMVPLAGLDTDTSSPMWGRVGTFIFRFGRNFYNFQGLRQFKDKFDPVWGAKYLVAPNAFAVPKILVDASLLISRGR